MSNKHDPEYFATLIGKVHREYAIEIDAHSEQEAKSMRQWFYNHRKWLQGKHIHIYDGVSVMLAKGRVIFYHTQLGFAKAQRLAARDGTPC